MGAAVLHFEHWPGAAEGADLKGGKGRLRRQGGQALSGPRAAQQTAFRLLRHQKIRLGPDGAGPWTEIGEQLGRATGQDQARGGGFAPQAKNGVARVAFAPGGNGATVDAEHIGLARRVAFHPAQFLPGFAQGLAFVLIDLAAEGDDEEFPCGHGR